MNKQLSPSIAFFIICVFLVLEYLFYNWLYIKFYFSTIFNFVFYFIKHRSIIILMSVSDNSNIQSIHKFLSPLFQLIVDYVVLSFVCSVKLCLCFHCIWKIFCWNYFRQRWYYIPFGLLLSNIRLSSNTRPLVWGLLQKVCEEYCFFFSPSSSLAVGYSSLCPKSKCGESPRHYLGRSFIPFISLVPWS